MPCILSTTARTAFRSAKTLHGNQKFIVGSRLIIRQYAATAQAMQHPEPKPMNSKPSVDASRLTPAQTARAAFKAIHISLKHSDAGLDRAFLIVNSLHFSNFASNDEARQHPLYKKLKETAIAFGRPIPPRLASAALIHGLVRLGKVDDAGRLAVQTMSTGFRLKTKTLNLVHKNLIPPGSTHEWNSSRIFPSIPNCAPNLESLSEIRSIAQTETTRLALDLFVLASENHDHQTQRDMFATLITLCLINGEIVLASLLLGYFIKDAHSRGSIPPSSPSPSLGNEISIHNEIGQQFTVRRTDMRRVLKQINRVLSHNDDSGAFFETLQMSLQALANLASLLEYETILVPELPVLLRLLCRTPRVGNLVWVCGEDGEPTQVEAYDHFHWVLESMIKRLPTSRDDLVSAPEPGLPGASAEPKSVTDCKEAQNTRKKSPDLCVKTYNTLLNYSLRQQSSLPLAQRILLHMMHGRQGEPMAPSQDSFNIIFRAGTLLQDPDIARQAIEAYKRFYPLSFRIRRRRAVQESKQVKTKRIQAHDSATALLISLARTRFSKLKATPTTFLSDNHAMSNVILHLTSTGKPKVISGVLWAMFPELFIPLHTKRPPHRRLLSSCIALDLRGRIIARARAARRGVSYGPYIFSGLLNALNKAGMSKLAWAVWLLALRSEKRSWKSPEPWFLHISAYDSILKCLAMDMRHESQRDSIQRVRRVLRGRRGSRSTWVTRPTMSGWNTTTIEEVREGKALNAAWLLYHAMKDKEDQFRKLFFKERQNAEEAYDELNLHDQMPKPDARLFNSMLELVILPLVRAKRRAALNAAQAEKGGWGYQAQSSDKLQQQTPNEIWEEFDHLRKLNMETGYVSEDWNPMFQTIAEDMVAAGYHVPAGLRYMFIGRWEPGMRDHPVTTLNRTPYANPYEAERQFSPYHLPVPMEKSLRLRRMRAAND